MTKEIINVTEITEYFYCPRKVYLRRIKGIKPFPNKAIILGFLKHKFFDLFNKNEPVIVSSINEDIAEEEVLLLYNNRIKAIVKETSENYSNMINTFKINSEELEQQVLDFLKRDLLIRANSIKKTLSKGFREKELWRNLKPKYLTEFQITSPILGLKGRVDRVEFSDSILPYEIKTRENIYESDKIQLAAYSLLLEEEFNKKINKGIIEASGKREEIELTKEIKDKALETAEKIRNMEEGKEPEFQSNFKKCQNCMLKKECFGL